MSRIHAVTDGSGNRVTLATDAVSQPFGVKRKSPWNGTPAKWKRGLLSDLTTDIQGNIKRENKYNVLAQHMLSEGVKLETEIMYGYLGSTKVIRFTTETHEREYRCVGLSIVSKRRAK